MDDMESTVERLRRLARLSAQLVKRVAAGEDPLPLREHLEVAMMMSPIAYAEKAAMIATFDDAVAARMARSEDAGT